jgi:hypothetical protein
MTKRGLAGILAIALLFGSSSASADPSNWAHLGQILLWLERIDATLRDINELVDGVKEKLFVVYPEGALREIRAVFEPVDSIQTELGKLSCAWRFTPRVDRLRLALYAGGSFCRSDWNVVFGPPTLTTDWDLEGYYDFSAVRRLGLIRARNQKSAMRADEAHWLVTEALKGRNPLDPTEPYSPGYAQRLSALGAAQLGNLMVEMGDTQTAMLELDQEALNDRRRRRLLDHQTSTLVYAGLTTLRDSPPDPSLLLLGDWP